MRTLLILSWIFVSVTLFCQRRMVAEWEPAYGTLIRWPLGIPGDLVKELAEDDSLYVLVENLNQQLQAVSTFNSYGVNLDHCRFIIANTYSHWTRDWGPHYVFDEDGEIHIADPFFDGYPWVPGCNNRSAGVFSGPCRGYEEDDSVNLALANEFDIPLISLPCYLTGGNIMTDGHGHAVSTRQMLDENTPICDEGCFFTAMADSMGLNEYSIAENPEVYGIQHIDCYAKFLDEERVLVKQLPAWHPEYHCVEDLADFLGGKVNCYGRNFEVVRIFCAPYAGNEVAAYTNSLILNKKVLVPLFNIPADEQALQTYRDAMPGYDVLGFDGNWYYYDALHCRTMGIFDPGMLVIWHKQPHKAQSNIPVTFVARIDDRSEAGLKTDMLRLYWREEGNMLWNHVLLDAMPQPDSFLAELPAFPGGTVLEYYFSAADSSGRQEKCPRTAPGGFYQLEVSDIVVGIQDHPLSSQISVYPVPFRNKIAFRIEPAYSARINVRIFDMLGTKIWEYNDDIMKDVVHTMEWIPGNVSVGVYLARITIGEETFTARILK